MRPQMAQCSARYRPISEMIKLHVNMFSSVSLRNHNYSKCTSIMDNTYRTVNFFFILSGQILIFHTDSVFTVYKP